MVSGQNLWLKGKNEKSGLEVTSIFMFLIILCKKIIKKSYWASKKRNSHLYLTIYLTLMHSISNTIPKTNTALLIQKTANNITDVD